MLTIKYTDQDGYERITQGYDVRAAMDGKFATSVGWFDIHAQKGCAISHATTVYVMSDAGSTVAKYIVIPEAAAGAEEAAEAA